MDRLVVEVSESILPACYRRKSQASRYSKCSSEDCFLVKRCGFKFEHLIMVKKSG